MKQTKVVLVDDDEDFLAELKEILEAGGYDTVAVNDPSVALPAIQHHRPDIVLLDLKMPNKTGFELADEINHACLEERVPIIAMSAYFKDNCDALLNYCGIKRCLRKPFNPLDVISEIETVIAEKEKSQ